MKPYSVRDVTNTLEAWAPVAYAYDWDPVGLAIGNPGARVSGVLVCLTVNREALQAARDANAEMIVSHHPLIFSPLDALRTDVAHTKLCLDIAQADMACYSAHTNLDVVPGGVSHILAGKLGLLNVHPLVPVKHVRQMKLVVFVPESHLALLRDAVCAAGAGTIGNYTRCAFSGEGVGTFVPGPESDPYSGRRGQLSEEAERRFETLVPRARLGQVLRALHEAHPYEEPAYDIYPIENHDPDIGLGVRGELCVPMQLDAFAEQVGRALSLAHVRVVGRVDKAIKTVGALGGSGGGELGRLSFDLDVCVTGDVKYHDALDALDRGVCVIDAGHAGTELPAVRAITDYLCKALPGLLVTAYEEPPVFRMVVP